MRELEKKFSGKHVVFIAQRRILPKPTRKANKLKQKRPRSRTLLAVHNSILDDLVYPAEIVGKRIRIRLDGSRLFKVYILYIYMELVRSLRTTNSLVKQGFFNKNFINLWFYPSLITVPFYTAQGVTMSVRP